MPRWLAAIHRVLPSWDMAVAIPAGLRTALVTGLTRSFLVLSA